MTEISSVPATNGGFSVAAWIPCKSDAWGGIEQVALHAAGRNTGSYAALNDTVGQIRNRSRLPIGRQVVPGAGKRIHGGLTRYIMGWIEFEGRMLLLTVVPVHAQPQAE